MTRRTLITAASGAAIAAAQTPGEWTLKPRASKDIRASPISIGFETLDRQMFDPERTYGYLAQTGVKWARCQTGWARTEKRKGEYDFAWLDAVVDRLISIGITPWFNLGYGNKLYTPDAPHESAVGWAPLNSPEAEQAWLRFVSSAAQRYAKRVRTWEIWNEPTIPNFWQPGKPDPDAYMKLVRMTVPTIRREIPDATIVGGVLTSFPILFPFAERCMELGLGDLADKFSYHPYRPIPEANYRADIRSLRGIVHRYKPGMPLWQGENGAPSIGGGTGALNNFTWSETTQAKWLLRRLITDLAVGIEVTSYFHTVDLANYVWTTGQSGQTNPKGVLRASDYKPKLSFRALQNVCALFDSDTHRADLSTRVVDEAGAETCEFIRNGYAMHLFWDPADLQKPETSRSARLTVWSGKAARLSDPVMVDLFSGIIRRLPKSQDPTGLHVFENIAVRDYPLLITDAQLVS